MRLRSRGNGGKNLYKKRKQKMETSNLIALGALIVAVLGLLPQFYTMISEKKTKNKIVKAPVKIESKTEEQQKENVEKEPMPPMLRILMLVIFAVASFLIEIIIFGIIAHLCGVNIDLATMSLIWKVIFYSLFFIPGVFLFLAFLTFVANTTD
jgi:hypothetical protein